MQKLSVALAVTIMDREDGGHTDPSKASTAAEMEETPSQHLSCFFFFHNTHTDCSQVLFYQLLSFLCFDLVN